MEVLVTSALLSSLKKNSRFHFVVSPETLRKALQSKTTIDFLAIEGQKKSLRVWKNQKSLKQIFFEGFFKAGFLIED